MESLHGTISRGIVCWMVLGFSCVSFARQIGPITGESENLAGSGSGSSLKGAGSHSQSLQTGRPVELAWGISEVHTALGKILNFTIPKDAFDGEILDIKVSEVQKENLPPWLTFDSKSRLFTGLPFQPSTVGTHYIAVTVLGAQGTSAKDVFAIVVTESSPDTRCSSEAAQTVLTIVLDVDWEALPLSEREELLSKFSNYMDIPVAEFKVSPVTGSSATALLDSAALIAGPGNAERVKHPGIKLSSVVGCDGNLDGNHRQLATFVEEAAKDGSMARFTGADVVGWHLTSAKPVPQPRHRRQYGLNTPEPSPIQPTLIAQPGGEVHATQYLTNTPDVESTYGGAEIGATGVYTGIHPTATVYQQIVPTASVGQEGGTPPIVLPPPVIPPPKPPGQGRSNLPPTLGDEKIGGGKPIHADAGMVYEFHVPRGVWRDPDSDNLNVRVKEESTWLEVENKADGTHLTGIPLAEDKGTHPHTLVVSDGQSTLEVPFQIDVAARDEAKEGYNHEMEVILENDFHDFKSKQRMDFVKAVQGFYGDPNSKNVMLRSVKSGSTHVSWLNSSLNNRDCGDPAISAVTKRVFDNDQVNPQFREHFDRAGFKVQKAQVHKIGKCGPAATAAKSGGSDIYISTVVPAVVVSSLLLLACCIACILYRKRTRAKHELNQESDTIFNKGNNKPLIMAGEINDNNSKGNNGASKKPAILDPDHERGGTLPPPYNGKHPRQPHPLDGEQNIPLLQQPAGTRSPTTVTTVRDADDIARSRPPHITSPSHR